MNGIWIEHWRSDTDKGSPNYWGKISVPVTTELNIRNSRGIIDEDSGLLGCNAVLTGIQSRTFRRGLLPPSSGCSIPINSLRKTIQEECLATLNVFCLPLYLCWRGTRLSLLENRVKIIFAPPTLWRRVEGERIIVLRLLTPPRRYPYFDVVVGLVWSHDPKRYVGGSICYW
jgi:hypothetical protein